MAASADKPTKLKLRLLLFAKVLVLLLLAAGVYLERANRASAIEATLKWGQLASFPVPERQLTVKAEGSMFTQAFRVHFVAAPEVIEEWLSKSLGVRNPKPDSAVGNTRHYQLVPGGGAQHAEIEIDDDTHTVHVYACWS
jgi:hypothetical protein